MKRLSVSIAALALTIPLAAQQRITCSSDGGRRFCPADTHNGVLLLNEQSNGVCQKGTTWVELSNGIRVSGGCSADFLVSGGNGNNGNGYGNGNNGSYGNNGGNPAYNNNAYGNNNGYGNNGGNPAYSNQGGNGSDRDHRRHESLPAGTQLSASLNQAIRPAQAQDGDIVAATLASDVQAPDGRVLVPQGTPVQLKVHVAQNGTLDIRPYSLEMHGEQYTLATNAVHGLGDSVSAQNANGNRNGGALGNLLGALTGGPDMPAGTVFNFTLISPSIPTHAGG